MSRFTPGPWRQAPDAFYYVENRYGEAVAHTIETSNEKESRANARLIAAAPDLLEAAKYLLQHHLIRDRLEGVSDTLQPRLDTLRAAIKKAEGE